MADAVDIQLLQNIPLFAKLTASELKELGGYLEPKPFEENQTIFWLGEKGTDFFLLQSGQVQLLYLDENGKEQQLATLKPGQFFGELSLLDGGPRTATARTINNTVLLRLGRDDFERFLLGHASAAFHILVILGQRQRDMLDKLRGIKNVNQVVEEEISRWHRVAEFVARMMSSPYFILGQIAIVATWVVVSFESGSTAFDPYPFNLLSLVMGVEALFLSAFVLVSQDRQGERDRVQADLDYQVNLKAHLEVVQLHQKVDRIETLLRQREETTETEAAVSK